MSHVRPRDHCTEGKRELGVGSDEPAGKERFIGSSGCSRLDIERSNPPPPADKHFAGEVGRPPLTLLTEGHQGEVKRRVGGSIKRGTMALTAADGTCRLVCHKISLGLELPSPTTVGSLEHPRPRYSWRGGETGREKCRRDCVGESSLRDVRLFFHLSPYRARTRARF